MKYKVLPAEREEQMKPWQRLIYNKYFVDEIYDMLFRKPLDGLSRFFYKFISFVLGEIVFYIIELYINSSIISLVF